MPGAESERRAVVAAFDVDGTLTTRDSVLPYLVRVAGARLPLVLLRRPLALAAALAARDHDRLKRLACAALAGVPVATLGAAGEVFARHVVERRLRIDTVTRLRRHRELGHVVVLVSASLEPYLEPLGALLGVDGVVCTRLETGSDGRCTGRLAGANCRGPEKVRRLRAWLDERDLGAAELWAYGDSAGDDQLLAIADHPHTVRGVRIAPEPERARSR